MSIPSPIAAFAAIFERTRENDVPMNVAADIDQILTEIGGYGMPIVTEADYAGLPIGTVVRGNGHYGQVAERVDEAEDGYRWVYTGGGKGAYEHATIARNLGEATVLFTPSAAETPEDNSLNEETSTRA